MVSRIIESSSSIFCLSSAASFLSCMSRIAVVWISESPNRAMSFCFASSASLLFYDRDDFINMIRCNFKSFKYVFARLGFL